MTYAVYIVDDHPLVRLGLRGLLLEKGLSISGEAGSGEEAFADPAIEHCQVMLLDIRLPGMDGLEVCKQIKVLYPSIQVLLHTGHDNPIYHARGMAAGANGLIMKSVPTQILIETLDLVSKGESCWTTEQKRRGTVAENRQLPVTVTDVTLTPREMDVLIQLANGLTNKEIANSLGIGYETVKEHVQHVLRKLGVSDRTQAAVWAVRQQVV